MSSIPSDCCNKTGYVTLLEACGCDTGYAGEPVAGKCWADLTGCSPEFKPGYIAAAVLGTVAICAIFFVVCYFKICRSKEDDVLRGKSTMTVANSSNTPAVAMTATSSSSNAPQYTSMNSIPNSSSSVQPLSSIDSAEDGTPRNANLPASIQSILPARYKLVGEGAQPSSIVVIPGDSNYEKPLSGGEEAKVDVPKPPPVDPNHLPIFYGEVQYKATKLLGQGNFGRAYLVTNEKGRQLVIKTQFCPTKEQLVEANEEALTLMQFKSEHLLEITDVFPEGAQELCLVINFCSGGTLADQVSVPNPVEEVIRMVRELSRGLSVLHAKGYIHRDIKPDNIFLADKESRRVVIGDMGLARKVDPRTGYFASTFGHTLYKAPEIARSQFSWRSDMWAVGCVLLELLSHATMMEHYSQGRIVLGVMAQADLDIFIDRLIPDLVGTEARQLLHGLLVVDSQQRLTADQVAQWGL